MSLKLRVGNIFLLFPSSISVSNNQKTKKRENNKKNNNNN